MKLCLSELILYALSDDSSRISLHQVTSNFKPISGTIFVLLPSNISFFGRLCYCKKNQCAHGIPLVSY